MTKEDLEIVIIVACAAVVVLVFIVAPLIRLGIIGHRDPENSMGKVHINEGMNVDFMSGRSAEIGLNGFGENRLGTVVVGLESAGGLNITLENVITGLQFSGVLMDRLVFGRKNNQQIWGYVEVSDDSSISKLHMEMIREGNSVYVRDLGSSNHTWINGNYLTDMADVYSGDIIRMGNSEYRIYIT